VDHDLDLLAQWPAGSGSVEHIRYIPKKVGVAEPLVSTQLPAIENGLINTLQKAGLAAHVPRQADTWDTKFLCQPAHDWYNGPLGVDMMMGIQMSRFDPRLDDLLQLRPQLFIRCVLYPFSEPENWPFPLKVE
jgi:hypothetical protein